MNIHALECFVMLAQTLNFTKAAENCYISQPAFSKQIATLEKQLGIPLFLRSNKTVTLTAAGKSCLEYAQNIVHQHELLLACAQEAANPKQKELRVGCLSITGAHMLLNAQNELHRIGNPINITLTKQTQNQQVDAILSDNSQTDAVFVIDFGLKKYPQLDSKTIFFDHTCVILPKNHPLSRKSEISILDLVSESFIQNGHDTAKHYINTLTEITKQYGFLPNISVFEGSLDAVVMRIALGEGICFTVLSGTHAIHSDMICIRRIKEDISIPVLLVWNKKRYHPSIPAVADALISLYGNQ